MGLEVGFWRVDGTPQRLQATPMPMESELESMIESEPQLVSEDLMIIGRQVPTAHGGFIDLLGLNSDGVVQLLELKRHRTPREVVAQLLDYASWVQELSGDDLRIIYTSYKDGGTTLDEEFAERFGAAPPDELGSELSMTIVAGALDPSSERIVSYLNEAWRLPINAVFFRYFEDNGHAYVARTWLVQETSAAAAAPRAKRTTQEWGGDWYVSFGEHVDGDGRSWEDARRFGFISAGGGEWYSRTLRNLPLGGRIFACIPNRGYVGVGEVLGPPLPAHEAVLDHVGGPKPFLDLPLTGDYTHPGEPDRDMNEYVVPIRWTASVRRDDAIWETGMFANQNSACKLRSQFTIERVLRHLNVQE
ncbi:MAG TPA: endonuclease NucS domain-containing protein [Naasia sp.]|jgi:hypothetical protein